MIEGQHLTVSDHRLQMPSCGVEVSCASFSDVLVHLTNAVQDVQHFHVFEACQGHTDDSKVLSDHFCVV